MTHAHDDRLVLTPPKPCPGCDSTGKHRPFCPEVYAMTFAPQPRQTLASLTDAQVRALLDPTGCSDDDYIAGIKAGLMRPRATYGHGRTDEGDRYLAEAQRIADGLSDDDAGDMVAAHAMRWDDTASWDAAPLAEKGLVRRATSGGIEVGEVTPFGKLALALRGRSKAPESSADELERLAQEHEDGEVSYRESEAEARRER